MHSAFMTGDSDNQIQQNMDTTVDTVSVLLGATVVFFCLETCEPLRLFYINHGGPVEKGYQGSKQSRSKMLHHCF